MGTTWRKRDALTAAHYPPSILCSRFLFWLKSATVAKAGYSRLMAEEIRRQHVLVSLPHPIQV